MSRIVVLAIVLALGSSVLSAGAFARSRGYGVVAEVTVFAAITSGAASAAFPATVMAVTLTAPGSRGGFRGYVDRDMWGQWGAYYGPMIPTI